MTSSPPSSESSASSDTPSDIPADDRPSTGWTDVRFRAWNLLLLVPLISCLPPLFNTREPSLGGLPFFYWFQLAVIPVGILCTLAVHLLTRHVDEDSAP